MKRPRFVNILDVDNRLQEKVRCWRNKKGIRKYMLNQHIINRKEHSEWLNRLRKRKDTKFWVVFFGKTPIGTVYLNNINHEKSTTEWGFYIGDDEYKGRGLGKIILFKLLRIVFDKMKLGTFMTSVQSDNTIALALYKKFRFKETAKELFNPLRRNPRALARGMNADGYISASGRELRPLGRRGSTAKVDSILFKFSKHDWKRFKEDLKNECCLKNIKD